MAREVLWLTVASLLATFEICNPVDKDGRPLDPGDIDVKYTQRPVRSVFREHCNHSTTNSSNSVCPPSSNVRFGHVQQQLRPWFATAQRTNSPFCLMIVNQEASGFYLERGVVRAVKTQLLVYMLNEDCTISEMKIK